MLTPRPQGLVTSTRARLVRIGRLLGRFGLQRVRFWLRGVFATRAERARLREHFHVHTAEQAARALGEMKGVMMKLGQILSFSVEAMPPEARRALESLQRDAPPMDFPLVRGVLEADLGRDLAAHFRDVDEEPIAAASIGQVHRARLRDGTHVVLKVQYPGVAEAMRADLRASAGLATLVRAVNRHVDAEAVVDELREVVAAELDYAAELRNQALFGRIWAGHPLARVPRVYEACSGPRVLCQEHVRGLPFREFVEGATAKQKRIAIHVLHDFVFDSMNRFCVFNGDPHPGNYLFHEDGGISFLDYGCVKRFRPDFLDDLARMNRALVESDRETFVDAVRRLNVVLPGHAVDAEKLEGFFRYHGAPFLHDDVFHFTKEWLTQAGSVMSIPNLWGINLPRDFLFFLRITFGLNSIFLSLDAAENFHRWNRRYLYPHENDPPAVARLGLPLSPHFLSTAREPAWAEAGVRAIA